MTRKQRTWNIIAIYFVAALQMGGAGLSPLMASLSEAFPSAGATAIQFVMTVQSITVVLTNLFTGRLCEKYPKKYLTAIGCGLAVLFALLGFLFNRSLTVIYIWAAILGIGTSLACTVSPAIVNEMFEPEERVGIFGVRACASSIGTMLMTFVGGYLVAIHWRYGFLVYLIMIPGLILALAVHPKDTKLAKSMETHGARGAFRWKGLVFPCVAGFSVSLLYSVAMVNVSMLVSESGFVPPEAAAARGGLLSTVLLAVGGLVGFGLNRLTRKIGLHCMTLGFLSLATGYGIIFFAPSYALFILGGIVCGGAITFVMPHAQILGSDAGGSRQELGLSITLLCANLGTLVSPLLTALSKGIFNTDAVRFRFLFAGCLALVIAALIAAQVAWQKRKSLS